MRALLTLLLAMLLWACTALPPSASSAVLDEPLPPFKRRSLDGRSIDTRQPMGKPLVVKFFAEYCEPCKRTLPAAQRLSERHPDVLFVGISEDESRDTAARMAEQFGLAFPVVHDEGNALAGRFGASELPISFVADRRGVIRWVGGPEQSEADLAAAVDWVLQQP